MTAWQPARRVHRLPVRIYFEDTDAGGIVYHANYLKFAERARTELLRAVGLDHPALRRRHGIIFAVRRAVLDCLTPGRLDDRLEVLTEVVRRGGASLTFRQEIRREDEPVAIVLTRVAMVDGRGRPARMPDEVKDALVRWSTSGDAGAKDV